MIGGLLATVLIVSACTRVCLVRTDLRIPGEKTGKIPLRVGLYMSPEFLSYSCTIIGANGDTYSFPLGEAFRSGADAATKMAFEETVILSSINDAMAQNTRIIISPEVEEVDMVIPGFAFRRLKSLVIMKWAVADLTGRTIWVGTFEGEGDNIVGYLFRTSAARKCMQRAVEQQFAKALQGIRSSPCLKSVALLRNKTMLEGKGITN